ncbi:5-formyltetrahydrofolate cyclo-ligase [Halosolutus amylolyticus]|uniref:5-formyltetrahydrofolate cyclo-ligase n=1 Tax=Halosolutus amylolyticus TaxID=2932267 RepID=A0ABD5PV47_9EURY|nr:5-formyltetrahydrofolate cyclo-ligase [Halosolutus amylolyticus]
MAGDDDRADGDRTDDRGDDDHAAGAVEKEPIRQRIWDELEERGVARFPFPPHGRIPNFAGADRAADRLADQPEWEAAETIKANPDAPQLPVRRRALRDGKTVYMAVPRLADERCFLKLDPDALDDYDAATTVSGSSTHGEQVGPEAVEPIDLVVSGSVAVTTDGGRIGKGEGYSDLEYAVLRDLGLVDDGTPVATTVHERQVIDDPVAIGDHDVAMTLVVTTERTLRPPVERQPTGVDWTLLDGERREEIPVLQRLHDRSDG